MNPRLKLANPGPSWGYSFLLFANRILPKRFFFFLLGCGSFVAMFLMPRQRKYSMQYLNLVLKRTPHLLDAWRHFYEFTISLILKLKVADGWRPQFEYDPEFPSSDFRSIIQSKSPALLGTFHLGQSDLMGCMVTNFERSIALVRLKVNNSKDTELLKQQFGNYVRFIWINQPKEFLLSLKSAVQSGYHIGIQCDRPDFSHRNQTFEFLGRKRTFPMTIYHLAYLFRIPVVFSFACPGNAEGSLKVVTSPAFYPAQDRDENAITSTRHFKSVLEIVEFLLMENPYIWFNFIPFEDSGNDV